MTHEIAFDLTNSDTLDAAPDLPRQPAGAHPNGANRPNALGDTLMRHLDALSDALHSPAWEQHCRRSVRGHHPIPAGTTYLAQLMAHDTSQTLNRIDIFEPGGPDQSTLNALGTPLLLTTLYGSGRHGNRQLFNKFWFRVGKGGLPSILVQATDSPTYDPITSTPLLADPRNADTPVLLFVTSAFMHYHNAVFDRLRNGGTTGGTTGGTALNAGQKFVLARALVIRTWHRIIRSDILDRACRDVTVCGRTEALTHQARNTRDITVLAHSALRCFHALVLKNYHVKDRHGTHSIEELLSPAANGFELRSLDTAELANWTDQWQPDWPVFFDTAAPNANVTGFTPSFVFSAASVDIAKRDFVAARLHQVPRLAAMNVQPERIQRLYRALNIVVPGQIDWVAWGSQQPVPIMLGLLADGFFETEIDAHAHPAGPVDLRLGPAASALVRCGIEKLIDAAEKQVAQTLARAGIADRPPPFELPGTFIDMINFQ